MSENQLSREKNHVRLSFHPCDSKKEDRVKRAATKSSKTKREDQTILQRALRPHKTLMMNTSTGLSIGDTNVEDDGLGVTVSLSSEIADRLRQHQPPGAEQLQLQQQQPKLSFLSKKTPGDCSSDDDEEEVNEIPENKSATVGLIHASDDPLDNWNEVLPIQMDVPEVDSNITNNIGQNDIDNNDNNNEQQDEEEDSKSVGSTDSNSSPPPHMPVVVVDMQRLVGYRPMSTEDREELEHQIHAALWYGSAEAASAKSGGNPQEDTMQNVLEAAQHFDKRVTELLESGVARHATTEEIDNDKEKTKEEKEDESAAAAVVVVQYPEYLCAPKDTYATDDNFAPRTVLSTARIWKRLLRQHEIPVVNNLLLLLQRCHRSLVWKHAMHQELWELARAEQDAKERRHQTAALRDWKTTKRQHQLDQLYQVRETLEHRLEMAKTTVLEMQQARDRAVKLELRRRRMETGMGGGLEVLDLNSTILAFPDEAQHWMGLEDDDDDQYDDQVGPSFVSDDDEDKDGYDGYDSDASGYDAEGDLGEEDEALTAIAASDEPLESTSTEADAVLATFNSRRDKNKARRAAVAKKRRRRLEEAAKEAEHQNKLDQANAEEAKVRELCTTNDLKMSQAIKTALEKKLDSVDELLESLQEEVWEDEEAQESGKPLVPGTTADDGVDGSSGQDFSLLDQVLAMILGSFPPPTSASTTNSREDAAELLAKHTQELQMEHTKIVKEWKEYFGRLPHSVIVDLEEAAAVVAAAKDQSVPDEARQSELRSSFGISENEAEDWEDADSDNDDSKDQPRQEGMKQATPGSAPPAQPRAPPKVGLRPGGRMQR